MAIIPALNSHSLRLHLGNCGVSLVEVSVWKVRQTLVLVCVPQVYVPLLYVLLWYVCVLCVHILLALPIPLGAWSMTLVLWQPLKYYYLPTVFNYITLILQSHSGKFSSGLSSKHVLCDRRPLLRAIPPIKFLANKMVIVCIHTC